MIVILLNEGERKTNGEVSASRCALKFSGPRPAWRPTGSDHPRNRLLRPISLCLCTRTLCYHISYTLDVFTVTGTIFISRIFQLGSPTWCCLQRPPKRMIHYSASERTRSDFEGIVEQFCPGWRARSSRLFAVAKCLNPRRKSVCARWFHEGPSTLVVRYRYHWKL